MGCYSCMVTMTLPRRSRVVQKYAPALMCKEILSETHIKSSPMGGTLIFPFSPIPSPPRLPPTLPLCLHSWPSSLLSSNCSSVLGNGGRKSQSFRRATMTIKNIFFGRKVRKRGRKRFSRDSRKGVGGRWRWEAWAEMKEKSGKRDGRRW